MLFRRFAIDTIEVLVVVIVFGYSARPSSVAYRRSAVPRPCTLARHAAAVCYLGGHPRFLRSRHRRARQILSLSPSRPRVTAVAGDHHKHARHTIGGPCGQSRRFGVGGAAFSDENGLSHCRRPGGIGAVPLTTNRSWNGTAA